MKQLFTFFLLMVISFITYGQTGTIKGKVGSNGKPIEDANVVINKTKLGTTVKQDGAFEINNVPAGTYQVMISAVGYEAIKQTITVADGKASEINAEMKESLSTMSEVVVTGTLKEVKRMESPVPVEVYTPVFFKKTQPLIFLMRCKM